ncbi:MAG TPA: NUDIX hydrolase [Pseudonocardiaceae bacterium]|nr:NUDIX hydrolase [Pseudonocardiaceae bacterium]
MAILAITLLVAIALTPFRVDVSGVLTLIVLVASVALLYRHYREARGSVDSISIVRHEHNFARGIPKELTVRHSGTVALYDRELSGQLTARMFSDSSTVAASWSAAPTLLAPDLQEHRDAILLHRYRSNSSVRPFNGIIVGQRSDIDVNIHDGSPVVFGATRYFDMMCSNYIADSDVTRQDRSVLFHGIDLMRGPEGNLLPLSRVGMSNGVGVSTLAFDSNGYLIVVAQSEDALSSPGGWAPSGSGSLEPIDFPAGRPPISGGNYKLSDVIIAGMNRELLEEANVEPARIQWSSVTGYFRWLSKGGKPEYVGVTVLDCRTEELRRKPRFVELRWVSFVKLGVHVDFERLKARPDQPQDALHANADRDDLVRLMSMPLFVGLRALGDRLRDERFERAFLVKLGR